MEVVLPPIRRTLLAALWGMPGPAIVGCLIALVFVVCEEGVPQDAMEWLGPIGKAARKTWWLPLGQAIVGAIYGLMRRSVTSFDGNWRRMSLRRGAAIGASVWALLGWVPFLLLLFVAAAAWINDSRHFPGLLIAALAAYALHIFGGVIAGVHVEYYLLRSREA